ncbi:MAG TPA: hypothetical protein VH540_02360 [Ktedonobacterales bacterium]|jgi:hypothetical protein
MQKLALYRLAAGASLLALIAMFFGLASAASGHALFQPEAAVGGCPLFPSDNIWNADISTLPVQANSANYIASIGRSGHLHPDFGAGLYNGEPIGIPYIVVPASQPGVPVSFDYDDESDAGPYPIPQNAPIEGGAQSKGDRHVIVVQSGGCKLYEMYASYPQSNGSWQAGSGAVWSLNSDALRPRGWTSADAAGLPILPGLVRYDEVAAGAITHALRFTVQNTRNTYVWPARHQASSNTGANVPPMGLRLRLKASVDISHFSAKNQVILRALKKYGMMVADNGSNWYISGAPDDRWNNDDLSNLKNISGSDFEVVDTSLLQISLNSGAARGAPAPQTPTTTTTSASPTTLAAGASPTLLSSTAGTSSVAGTASKTGAGSVWPMLLLLVGGGGVLLLGAVFFRRWLLRGQSP